ncbi:MAG: hypothetical protein AAB316_19545 [Bacteroidota bacterium]
MFQLERWFKRIPGSERYLFFKAQNPSTLEHKLLILNRLGLCFDATASPASFLQSSKPFDARTQSPDFEQTGFVPRCNGVDVPVANPALAVRSFIGRKKGRVWKTPDQRGKSLKNILTWMLPGIKNAGNYEKATFYPIV